MLYNHYTLLDYVMQCIQPRPGNRDGELQMRVQALVAMLQTKKLLFHLLQKHWQWSPQKTGCYSCNHVQWPHEPARRDKFDSDNLQNPVSPFPLYIYSSCWCPPPLYPANLLFQIQDSDKMIRPALLDFRPAFFLSHL